MDHQDDKGFFRFVIGFVALATAVLGFAALFIVKVPPENKDAMMFALGAVFGWAGSVIASEYGATTTGRKIAESVTRQIDRSNIGESATPTEVVVTNTESNAVPVENK
jgi:tRNA C32,U32 (ribose-2'-O)-methylase TrmJ